MTGRKKKGRLSDSQECARIEILTFQFDFGTGRSRRVILMLRVFIVSSSSATSGGRVGAATCLYAVMCGNHGFKPNCPSCEIFRLQIGRSISSNEVVLFLQPRKSPYSLLTLPPPL